MTFPGTCIGPVGVADDDVAVPVVEDDSTEEVTILVEFGGVYLGHVNASVTGPQNSSSSIPGRIVIYRYEGTHTTTRLRSVSATSIGAFIGTFWVQVN